MLLPIRTVHDEIQDPMLKTTSLIIIPTCLSLKTWYANAANKNDQVIDMKSPCDNAIEPGTIIMTPWLKSAWLIPESSIPIKVKRKFNKSSASQAINRNISDRFCAEGLAANPTAR